PRSKSAFSPSHWNLSLGETLQLTRERHKPTTLRSMGSTLRTARRDQRGIFFPYTSGRQRVC
ncbi:MAG: hypothetical protein WCG03_06405, partial [Kiritimatiellales bacterium]